MCVCVRASKCVCVCEHGYPILSTSKPTASYRHVAARADKRIREGALQLAADTKVAQLHGAIGVDKDIGGFDVAVHDTQLVVEVQQTLHNLGADDGNHRLGDAPNPPQHNVERPAVLVAEVVAEVVATVVVATVVVVEGGEGVSDMQDERDT